MYIDPVRYEGRPGNVPERLEKEQRCYALLDELQIPYVRVDHEHADTIEACEAVEQVLGEKICKNLFLCNRQKTQFYLLMLEGERYSRRRIFPGSWAWHGCRLRPRRIWSNIWTSRPAPAACSA